MNILDMILEKSYANLVTINNQTNKINNIEKITHKIKDDISYSEYIINKMSSILYNVKTKFIKIDNNISNDIHDKDILSYDNVINNTIDDDKDIINKIKKIKEINILIGDELDNHNDKLNDINIKTQDINYKINTLSDEINQIT